MSTEEKEQLIERAYVAKETVNNNYQDMVDAMKAAAKLGVELSAEEQKLFAFAYAFIVKKYRATNGFFSVLDEQSIESANEVMPMVHGNLDGLKKICEEVLSLLDNDLLPKTTNEESKVFYFKMKGDYHCYLAEIGKGDAKYNAINSALGAYLEAYDHLSEAMGPTNLVRLGLNLNFSIFYREILHNPTEASKIITQALNAAKSDVNVNDLTQDFIHCVTIMQKRIELWIHEEQ